MIKTEDIVIIKKYSNRRLYNTNISAYINIYDLVNLIKENVNFKIIEVKTDKDITRLALVQLIFDLESKGYDILPIEFLRYIIHFYDNSFNPLFIEYLQFITKKFWENENVWRKNMLEYNFHIFQLAGFQTLEELANKHMKLFSEAFNFFSKKL